MTKRKSGNINTHDEATVDDEVEVTVNNAVIALASNPVRFYASITVLDKDAFIRFMPASTETTERKGIFLKKNTTYELPTFSIYTGEISIINKKNNEKPTFYVTEY